MNDSVIAIRKEMITLSLIKDYIEADDMKSANGVIIEKLKRLGDMQTNLKINNPEMLVANTPMMPPAN